MLLQWLACTVSDPLAVASLYSQRCSCSGLPVQSAMLLQWLACTVSDALAVVCLYSQRCSCSGLPVQSAMLLQRLACTVSDPLAAVGQWSRWSSYSECTTSCGHGVQTRMRQCTSRVPWLSANDCPGDRIRDRSCVLRYCTAGQ